MNAPQIWILIPGIASVLLIVFQRWKRISAIISSTLALILATLAWFVPIGEKFRLLFWTIEITDSLYILGRRFILSSSDRPILVIIFSVTAFWIVGSIFARFSRQFIPLSLGTSVLLVAALAIEPFLYAAIILEMVVLVCIPLLTIPGKSSNRGVVRFLSFQTLAIPFILFTGWLLSGVEVNPEDSTLVPQAAILMAVGFSILFSIFPFHSWIPITAEESHPIPASYVFFIFPLVIGIFGINFTEQFSWLYSSPWLFVYLRFAGVLMIILGSIGAIFQNNLSRLMGFAVIIEIGISLLTISLGLGTIQNRPLMGIFFTFTLPRGISLGLWALSLSVMYNESKSLNFSDIHGMGYKYPLSLIGQTIAVLSLVGFPLTAGYSVHNALWQYLNQQFPLAARIGMLGGVGLIIGYFRGLSAMLSSANPISWKVNEKLGERVLLVVACASLIIFGIFPQLYANQLLSMGLNFLNLSP